MDNVVRIHFRGICTHLVNGSPHKGAPNDIGLKPVHDREPHLPIQHRVLLPWSLDLPENLKDIPQHYPRLRYRTGDLAPHEDWRPKPLPDDWWEVDLTRVAVWFRGVDETKSGNPAARALAELPSICLKTSDLYPMPLPDPAALNAFHFEKVASYVDFFGDQTHERLTKPVMNEVMTTLQVKDTPRLVWMPFGSATVTVEIKRGATLEISNVAQLPAPCRERDYLLHYRATLLDLSREPVPEWKVDPEYQLDPEQPGTPGPDGVFCSSSTYP
ncbi:MAG TPA: hypothetical protein VNN08_08835 [Thermoanaerobaculia bacterium]|nr:hypothetical protein [Thermoanaerobaculia bacterium]